MIKAAPAIGACQAMIIAWCQLRQTVGGGDIHHPSIIYLSKTSKHINRANQFKNTYNIGLDAKVHVGLFNLTRDP